MVPEVFVWILLTISRAIFLQPSAPFSVKTNITTKTRTMIIELNRPAPPMKQLMQMLQSDLGNEYSYKWFGVKQDSILIGKSFFYGAQISVHDNQISIQHSPPSVLAGFISTLAMTELAVLMIPFISYWCGIPSQSNINSFIKDIARVIKVKLNREG